MPENLQEHYCAHIRLKMTKLWRIWKYSLGSFSDEKTKQYDNHIVMVRTFILLTYFATNIVIVGGVIRHWNDNVPLPPINKEI